MYYFSSVSKENWSVIFLFIISLLIFNIFDIGVAKITGEVLSFLNLAQCKLDKNIFVKDSLKILCLESFRPDDFPVYYLLAIF